MSLRISYTRKYEFLSGLAKGFLTSHMPKDKQYRFSRLWDCGSVSRIGGP